ncbi:dihydrodipicolinate synthase family protein [Cryptosporangium minutisporangium]|uniref:Dihydrodipicolinate synthase family protein n=1 Tax=Cryptosporangium minutisporangium TaxID=113569 RepID=A0ABP6T319_9ACTN
MPSLRLPGGENYVLGTPGAWSVPATPPASRTVFAAAHVVADPFAENTPGSPAVLDWDATLAFRRHLWSWGLGVADAMDTAQRNAGLDWSATRELIARSAAEADGPLACGAGTDHAGPLTTVAEVVSAYEEQVAYVESTGAQVILMASRQLAAVATGPDDYHSVYSGLLKQVARPVILHWLGDMFDPFLAGYWGSSSVDDATETLLEIIRSSPGAVDGVKVSLLDASHEVSLRRRLPAGVKLYTGDDFHYPELIRGDPSGYSHALLGILDPIAPAASAALQALDAGDVAGFDAALAPTVPLARHLFGAPTSAYKTGIVFLAWLAGHQPAFGMVNGATTNRSLPHLVETFRLADRAGLLPDPDLAAARMRAFLAVHGL